MVQLQAIGSHAKSLPHLPSVHHAGTSDDKAVGPSGRAMGTASAPLHGSKANVPAGVGVAKLAQAGRGTKLVDGHRGDSSRPLLLGRNRGSHQQIDADPIGPYSAFAAGPSRAANSRSSAVKRTPGAGAALASAAAAAAAAQHQQAALRGRSAHDAQLPQLPHAPPSRGSMIASRSSMRSPARLANSNSLPTIGKACSAMVGLATGEDPGRSRGSGWRSSTARPLGPRSSMKVGVSMSDRRNFQLAAIAADRSYVKRILSENMEPSETREARERAVDDRWWSDVFAPIPDARLLLPRAFRHHPPFTVGLPTTVPKFDLFGGVTPMFTRDEMEDILRICILFHDLVTQAIDGGTGPPVITRPSFCRMICAMEGLPLGQDRGQPSYSYIVSRFDIWAEKYQNARGCTNSSGVVGLVLAYSLPSGGPFPTLPLCQDLPIIQLFGGLMEDLMVNMSPSMSRDEKHLLARDRMFQNLLPQAEKYARERMANVQRQVEQGTKRQTVSLEALSDSKEGPADGNTDDGLTDIGLPENGLNALVESVPSDPHMASVPAGSTMVDSSAQTSPSMSPSGASKFTQDGSMEGDQADCDTLFAHTFAVLKGELLASQLLEPEVMHLAAEFGGLFKVLFDAYCDIPVGGGTGVGHMTLSAFLRFCHDFRLFPSKVDLQTIQWLYYTASGTRTLESYGIQARSRAGSLAPDDSPQESGHRRKRRNSRLRMKRSESQDAFLYYGKWIRNHLAWLTSDFATMSDAEFNSACILWALHNWGKEHMMSVPDVFQAFDHDGNGKICPEELLEGLNFMRFENPPTEEDVSKMIVIIMPPQHPGEDLEFDMLSQALFVVQKQSDKLTSVAKSISQEETTLTNDALHARRFFQNMWKTLEQKEWTPQVLFQKLDVRNAGFVSAEELFCQTQAVLHLPVGKINARQFLAPFELLDLNGDGKITCEEFCSVMAALKQANDEKELSNDSGSLFALFNSACRGRKVRPLILTNRVFGHRAFAECLVKIGLVHLTYYGSPLQAEQPSFRKVLWLVTFLHWHFEHAKNVFSRSLPANPLVEERLPFARFVHLPPLRYLVQYYPDVFSEAPTSPPHFDIYSPLARRATSKNLDKAEERRPSDTKPCPTCDSTLFNGWGNSVCTECCHADAILRVALHGTLKQATKGKASLQALESDVLAAAIG